MENKLTNLIINAAIEVHTQLGGPGLLESFYERALVLELESRGIGVKTQVPVPVMYKGVTLRDPLRLDLLVDDNVIVEVKASDTNHSHFKAQTLTYLRLTNLKIGLVINFGRSRLVDGIMRVVN